MKETPTLHQLGALISQQTSLGEIQQEAWPMIIGAALQHGLAPMLLWIAKQTAPDIVIEPLWTPVISAARTAGIRYVSLEATRKQVSMALAVAQIPALWLKGIALAHTIYPQPVLRPMNDLDVLVPYEQRESALHVVENLGYHFYRHNGQLMSSEESLEFNLTHHYHLKGGINNAIVLELHFDLLSTDKALFSADGLRWFWTQTSTIQNGTQFTIPQPEAHLLYLCAHAILQHGERDTSLRQYFDLHQLITTTPINWDKVIEQVDVWGWGSVVDRALSIALQYFSTPIPDAVPAELRKRHTKHDVVADHIVRIRERGARWEQVQVRLRRLSRAEQVDLVRRILFPTRSYMRIRYFVRPGRPVLPFYLYRWFDQGQEVVWAMWNRLSKKWDGDK